MVQDLDKPLYQLNALFGQEELMQHIEAKILFDQLLEVCVQLPQSLTPVFSKLKKLELMF